MFFWGWFPRRQVVYKGNLCVMFPAESETEDKDSKLLSHVLVKKSRPQV